MIDKADLIQRILNASPDDLRKIDSVLTDSPEQDKCSYLIAPGLSVYRQRNRSRFWWARVLVNINGHRELRESTGEASLDAAKVKAVEIRARILGQAEKGVALEDKAFTVGTLCRKVVNELLANKNIKTTQKDYIYTFESHIIPVVGQLPIRRLDAAELKEYFDKLEFRSKTRLVIHRSCFKKLFQYATTHRYIQQRDVPHIPTVAADEKQTFREVIDSADYRQLMQGVDRFKAASRNKITLSYRNLLFVYTRFLLCTGVRPGAEALNIKYSDLILRKSATSSLIMCKIRTGKTALAQGREIVLNDQAVNAVIMASNINGLSFSKLNDLIQSHAEKFVFRPPSQKLPTFEKVFDQLIDFLGDKIRHKYTLYSFRHTYINDQLAKGVDIHTIAKQCGNSHNTIEQHYERRKAQFESALLVDQNEIDRLLAASFWPLPER